MLKLLFFFFLLFIIYKAIQFIGQVYRVYQKTQGYQQQQKSSNNQGQKRQYDGQTTIRYNPKQDENANGHSTVSKDEDYIDYKEIKEKSR